MAFWGVEIKPGKPYNHNHDNTNGRIRISQATLGNGKSSNKTTVQCNVGNKAPILLCHLIPDAVETCHLELEFDEPEEVVFSVLGQRSVHLSGYYTDSRGRGRDPDGDETDSYGEDIADTDTSGSFDDDDEYESDFIDDDADIGMYPTSPRRKSSVVIEEIEEDNKPSENGKRRRLKKKHQLSDSDNDVDGSQGQLVVQQKSPAVLESEDEDGFPISFSPKKQNAVNISGNSDTKSNEQTGDGEVKKKTDTASQEDVSARETNQPSDTVMLSEEGHENDEKSNKKKKKKKNKKFNDKKSLETTSNAPDEEGASVAADQDIAEPNTETKTVGDDGADADGKAKKKKKKAKKSKTTESSANESAEKTEDKTMEDTKENANDEKMDQDPPVSDKLEKIPNQSEVVDSALPPATDTDANGKLKKKNKKKRAKDDRGSGPEGGEAADINQTDANKKRKNESKDKELASAQESGEQEKTEATKAGIKTRTFSNGLVIDELAMGKPDGQKATPGKKVFVKYIGKLKNGKIFDSTVGKRPFAFRLGIGEVIKGWDVGVNGMRVGDKRRLTIPPSYGYGQTKSGPIPPNSWLTFDIELVSVK